MQVSIIPVTSYQQNCSLLVCEKTHKAALVDPGGDVDLLLAEIKQQQVTLEAIILTHGHLDHVGGSAELAALLNIPIIGPHQADQFLIDSIPSQCQVFGFAPCQSFTPTRWLKDGDSVQVGEEILEVLHCPGHTPGHIVLFHRPSQLALVGDVLFKGSIGRTDLAKGSFQQLITSIKQQLLPLGAEVSFIPGHGQMSTFGHEMRTNPFLNR